MYRVMAAFTRAGWWWWWRRSHVQGGGGGGGGGYARSLRRDDSRNDAIIKGHPCGGRSHSAALATSFDFSYYIHWRVRRVKRTPTRSCVRLVARRERGRRAVTVIP